jgi:hypothetical protein
MRRLGKASSGRHGGSWLFAATQLPVPFGRHGMAWRGAARRGMAGIGQMWLGRVAWRGTVNPDAVWIGRQRAALCGEALQGGATQAAQGFSRFGQARTGDAGLGRFGDGGWAT